MAMGLYLAGVFKPAALAREWRPLLQHTFTGLLGAFLLGVAFTTGWTPCIGPILAAILVYAGVAATVSQGVALLAAYAAGFFLPFVVIGVFLLRFNVFSRLLAATPAMQTAAGMVLVVAGILLFFDFLGWELGLLWL